MVIGEDYVFIHVPKNAGTSIRRALKEGLGGQWFKDPHTHASAQQIAESKAFELTGKTWDDMWKFCVFRNPWDRVVSMFHFATRTNKKIRKGLSKEDEPKASELRKEILSKGKRAFDYWLLDFIPKYNWSVGPYPTDEMPGAYIPQVQWITDHKVTVYDLWNMGQLQEEVYRRYDICPVIPWVNATVHGHYMKYHTKRTMSFIATQFAEDIELMGYTYECPKGNLMMEM